MRSSHLCNLLLSEIPEYPAVQRCLSAFADPVILSASSLRSLQHIGAGGGIRNPTCRHAFPQDSEQTTSFVA